MLCKNRCTKPVKVKNLSYSTWKVGKAVEEVEDFIEKEEDAVKNELAREHHLALQREARKEAEKEIKEKYKLKALADIESEDTATRERLKREAEAEVKAEAARRLAVKEKAEQDDDTIAVEDWATAIIKVSCILVIGVVILNSVVSSANMSADSSFAPLMKSVQDNIASGYTLAALMVLAIGAGAMMHFLGFM